MEGPVLQVVGKQSSKLLRCTRFLQSFVQLLSIYAIECARNVRLEQVEFLPFVDAEDCFANDLQG